MANKRAALKKATESDNHIAKKSSVAAVGKCSACGSAVESNVLAVTTKGSVLLCQKCKQGRHKSVQAKTPSYATPGRMTEYYAAWYCLKRKGDPGPMAEYRRKYGKGEN